MISRRQWWRPRAHDVAGASVVGLACLPSPPRRMCRPGTPVHRISPLSEQIGHAMGRRLGVEGLGVIRLNDGLACAVGDLILNIC